LPVIGLVDPEELKPADLIVSDRRYLKNFVASTRIDDRFVDAVNTS
jgi:hypothetical protein